MITDFALLIFFAFVIRSLRQILFQTYLWQLKEYRLDRMLAHLKSPLGKKLIFSPLSLTKWVLFLVIYVFPLFKNSILGLSVNDTLIIYAFVIFWLIWLLEAIKALWDLGLKKWQFPDLTFKSISVILIVSIVIFSPVINVHWLFPLLIAPLIDKLLALVVGLVVIAVNFPFAVYKNYLFYLAKTKIMKSKTKVIGITGSYGKTSTKEFLAALLAGSFKVISTPGSINTDTGIANFIIKSLAPGTDIFIAEMGAYRKGEIKKICGIIRPHIGLITGIGNQHLELFGSPENLLNTKFELIENLPGDGIAIINSTPGKTVAMIKRAENLGLKVIPVSPKSDLTDIRETTTGVSFKVLMEGKRESFVVKLAGVQNLENLLLAIRTAEILGLKAGSLKEAIKKINPPAKTMQIVKNSGKMTVIDDTFNVNYEGLMSALEYMKLYKGKKILFFSPIIELGNQSSEVHKSIGEKAGNICDYLVTTNINFFSDIQTGIQKSAKKKTSLLIAGGETLKEIKNDLISDSVLIFSGKESAKWLSSFITDFK